MNGALLVFCTSCVAGGAPFVGYGQHGPIAGVEVNAGGAYVLPQVAFGYQTDQSLFYVRGDETFDAFGVSKDGNSSPIGARVGVGVAFDSELVKRAAFVIGPLGSTVIGDRARCGDWNLEASVEIQFRLTGDAWSVVLAPRLQGAEVPCFIDSSQSGVSRTTR
jgi:hypothetical protein